MELLLCNTPKLEFLANQLLKLLNYILYAVPENR